jgi:hypothetical protein
MSSRATTKKSKAPKSAMQRWEDLVRKVFGGPQVGPYPSVGAYDPLPSREPSAADSA